MPQLALSQELYASAGEPKELAFYLDNGHGIELHRSEMLDKLHEWNIGLLRSAKN
jgi:hypothetical protein